MGKDRQERPKGRSCLLQRSALLTQDLPDDRIAATMTGFHDALSSDRLDAALAGHPFVTAILYRPILGSTNDVAKERAAHGTPEGLLVLAEEQTAGRGRMGRRWWAPAGSSLLTSLLFRPVLSMEQSNPSFSVHLGPAPEERQAGANSIHMIQQLLMLCALAAADAITEVTALPVDLKWPNDLIIRGRKLAGLLAESVFKGHQLDAVIVGLGLNVNTDFAGAPSFIATATSLRQVLGHPIDRMPLLIAYLDGVAQRYARFKQGSLPFDEWASRLVTLGQHVTVYTGSRSQPSQGCSEDHSSHSLLGVAQGVDFDGALLLCSADGTIHRLLAGDVSLEHEPSG